MMNRQPKVSVIIPIYNVEKYLDRTLYSATNQTLKELEIICVEDSSTDNSKEILEKYAESDPRIRCIWHTQNLGVSVSRKQAIQLATGKYIMFLDGDDVLDICACRELYHVIEKEQSDIVQFGTEVEPIGDIQENELKTVKDLLVPFLGCLSAKRPGEITNECFYYKKFNFSLWNKIYRTDVVKNAIEYYADARFNISEDMYLFFLISFFSKTYVGIQKKYYRYQFGAGITGGVRTLNDVRFKDKVNQGKILKLLRDFSDEYDPSNTTELALCQIEKTFVEDVSYNWFWHGNELKFKDNLRYACENFGDFEIMSRVLEMYYKCGYTKQHAVIERIQETYSFEKNRKIKTIGIFYFRMNNGGIEKVISKLMPIWMARGYRIVLFTEEFPSAEDYPYPDEVKRVVLPSICDADNNEIRTRMHYLCKMLQLYEVDTLVYHAWIWKYALVDILSAKASGVSVIMHMHSFFAQGLKSPEAHDAYDTVRITQIYRLCDAIVTLTETDKSWWSIHHSNVYKMLNPLPFELNQIEPTEVGQKTELLWIGRISREKQPVEALKIIRRVLDRGCPVKLRIIGRADDKEYYQEFLQIIEEQGLSSFVILSGYHLNVEPFYRNAAVMICTSEYEGFLMTLAESKAYGIPAVIYDLPNLDMVQQNRGMVIVKQGDFDAAAQAVIELMSDCDKRKLLGREARYSVEEMYSVDIAAQWDDLFSAIPNLEYKAKMEFSDQFHVAISMMIDFLSRGIEVRENELIWWKNQAQYKGNSLIQNETDIKDLTLELYRDGKIGFKYIIKYLLAWAKYKLLGKRA